MQQLISSTMDWASIDDDFWKSPGLYLPCASLCSARRFPKTLDVATLLEVTTNSLITTNIFIDVAEYAYKSNIE